MTPSWKFRDVPRTDQSLRAFYVLPWPDDLPRKCGICGTEFRLGFNLTMGPCKAGRMLRKAAYYGFLPCLAVGFILPGIFPEFYEGFGGYRGFWAFFGIMFFPPMLLGGLSVIMPRTRHLECKKCGWNHDYEIRNPEPLPPAS